MKKIKTYIFMISDMGAGGKKTRNHIIYNIYNFFKKK